MSARLFRSKLQTLRMKTDQDLVLVIDTAIDRALRLASLAAERKHTNDSGQANAQTGFADAMKLLTRVENVSERRRLEAKLAQLQKALDRSLVPDQPRARSASS